MVQRCLNTLVVLHAKQKQGICIAFLVSSSSSTAKTLVEILRLGHFSETIRARAMKLWPCIHLDDCSSNLGVFLWSTDFVIFVEFLSLSHFLRNYKG